ncbi:HpcH/HpaI aldolase/citrate lyase family protein [Schumannella luteola]
MGGGGRGGGVGGGGAPPPRPPPPPAGTPVDAAHRRADALVLDLEDGVASDDKREARRWVEHELESAPAWVRINDIASGHWDADLAAISGLPGLLGVVLAKAETAADVRDTIARLPAGVPVVPMVESAASLQRVEEIAAAGAARIAFGVGDFRRDTGIGPDALALAFARSRLVIASVAAGIPRPIDGPPIGDVDGWIRQSRAMGMTGSLVLDPTVIPSVAAAHSPSAEEIDWARSFLDRSDAPRNGGYRPTAERARGILELTERLRLLERE